MPILVHFVRKYIAEKRTAPAQLPVLQLEASIWDFVALCVRPELPVLPAVKHPQAQSHDGHEHQQCCVDPVAGREAVVAL